MKIQKKKFYFWGGGGGGVGSGSGWGGQGGCERRIEVFAKIQNIFFWGGGGVRVRTDVNEELKFLRKYKKKIGGGGVGGRVGGGQGDVKVELKIL